MYSVNSDAGPLKTCTEERASCSRRPTGADVEIQTHNLPAGRVSCVQRSEDFLGKASVNYKHFNFINLTDSEPKGPRFQG